MHAPLLAERIYHHDVLCDFFLKNWFLNCRNFGWIFLILDWIGAVNLRSAQAFQVALEFQTLNFWVSLSKGLTLTWIYSSGGETVNAHRKNTKWFNSFSLCSLEGRMNIYSKLIHEMIVKLLLLNWYNFKTIEKRMLQNSL